MTTPGPTAPSSQSIVAVWKSSDPASVNVVRSSEKVSPSAMSVMVAPAVTTGATLVMTMVTWSLTIPPPSFTSRSTMHTPSSAGVNEKVEAVPDAPAA